MYWEIKENLICQEKEKDGYFNNDNDPKTAMTIQDRLKKKKKKVNGLELVVQQCDHGNLGTDKITFVTIIRIRRKAYEHTNVS